jgi:Protein  of unknown function (DUF3018)
MGFEKPLTGAQRVAKRRAALRAQGLRPRTFWLPDTQTDAFRERARRDVARSWELVDHDADAMAFIEAITDELLSDLPD